MVLARKHATNADLIALGEDVRAELLGDRVVKAELYARAGVEHDWILDPADRLLEAFAAQHGHWLRLDPLQVRFSRCRLSSFE